ncbi:small integral membrane 14 [Brachionus plicatilis]|uniref:Small integral membrane protein 14 n=1 Tax=Brachionus plicatilis TaxID=10195 RepID=A0A3M7R0N5_BRAPC|nr:small integral membrane 14 [Brachionus plicatilis]
MSDENFDFCEYVYNPLMRQYQAMMRLMQMLRDGNSQSDCNDIQCFTSPNDPSNPMSSLNNGSSPSGFTDFLPMIFIWAMFVFALFLLRPNSMRQPKTIKSNKSSAASQNDHNENFRRDDDDDNSTVS